MICLLGDLHGSYQRVRVLDARLDPGVPILQVGDFGWYPSLRQHWNTLGPTLQRKLYWVDGNHEYFPEIPLDATEPVEVATNIYYVPRGTVLELDGRRIGCLGGAASVDKAWRKAGVDWFAEEAIRDVDVARATGPNWDGLDLIVTHVPPQCTIQAHFNPKELAMFNLPVTWRDPSADLVEHVWRNAGTPPLVCGHMHRSVLDGAVRILDINEALAF